MSTEVLRSIHLDRHCIVINVDNCSWAKSIGIQKGMKFKQISVCDNGLKESRKSIFIKDLQKRANWFQKLANCKPAKNTPFVLEFEMVCLILFGCVFN